MVRFHYIDAQYLKSNHEGGPAAAGQRRDGHTGVVQTEADSSAIVTEYAFVAARKPAVPVMAPWGRT
jgi:hypothetical protein